MSTTANFTLSSLLRNISRDSIIVAVGSLATSGLSLLLIPLFTFRLTPAEFGTYNILMLIARILGVLMVMGWTSAFNREYLQIAENDEQRNEVLSVLIIGLTITSLTVAVLGISIFNSFFEKLEATKIIPPIFISMILIYQFFESWNDIARRYWIVTKKLFSYVAFSITCSVVFGVVTVFSLRSDGDKLLNLVSYQALAGLGIFIFCYVYIFNKTKLTWSSRRGRNMFVFALPMMPAGLSYLVIDATDRFFIQSYLSMNEVGIYSLSYKASSILQIVLVGPLTMVISPYIFRIAKQEDTKEILANVYKYTCFLLTSVIVLLSLFLPYLIREISPPEYWSGIYIIPWVLFSYGLYALNYILVAGIHYSAKSYLSAAAIIIGAIINVMLNFILIPEFGISGAIASTFISFFVTTFLTAYFAERLFKVNYDFFGTAFFALISIGFIHLTYQYEFTNYAISMISKILAALLFLTMGLRVFIPDVFFKLQNLYMLQVKSIKSKV